MGPLPAIRDYTKVKLFLLPAFLRAAKVHLEDVAFELHMEDLDKV